jgi:hypothetical protein
MSQLIFCGKVSIRQFDFKQLSTSIPLSQLCFPFVSCLSRLLHTEPCNVKDRCPFVQLITASKFKDDIFH